MQPCARCDVPVTPGETCVCGQRAPRVRVAKAGRATVVPPQAPAPATPPPVGLTKASPPVPAGQPSTTTSSAHRGLSNSPEPWTPTGSGPPPPLRRMSVPVLALSLGLVVVVVVLIVTLAQRGGSTAVSADTSRSAASTDSPRTSIPPTSSASSTPMFTTPPPTTKPAASDDSYWTGLLTERARLDDPALESHYVGRWVPQLSSKRIGLVANGLTYRPNDIWNDYGVLRGRYPGATLLYSGTWSTFSAPDFWVTVASTSYSTPNEANAWCDAKGIDRDNCFAKLLSHTLGTEGTTVLR